MSNWLSHGSFVGHLGSYGDRWLNPISWATHGKSTKLTSEVLPEKVNNGLSHVMQPFDWIDQKVNPVRKIPIVDRAANIIKAKPGDALAIAAGAFFGGSAALGGGGAGGAGGGVAGGTAAGGGEAGLGAGSLGTSSGFGGVGMDAGATGWGGASAGGAGGTGFGGLGTSSGFGGVGMDAGATGWNAAGTGLGSGSADVGGLAAQDSAAVSAEGAEPGLTQSYGPASSNSFDWTQMGKSMAQNQQQQQNRAQQQALIPMYRGQGLLPTSTLNGGQYFNPNQQ